MKPEAVMALLERAAADPWGTHRVDATSAAVLAKIAEGDTYLPIRAVHIIGFLHLLGPARNDVRGVVGSYALAEDGMLQAACWNPALTDEDVLGFARKFWDGRPEGPGKLLPGPARKLTGHPRIVAAAMGALGVAYWEHHDAYLAAVREIVPGGRAAVEVFATLYAERDPRYSKYGKVIPFDAMETVQQALLVVG